MAITINDLILFNNVESTDLLQGVLESPYYKPLTFIRNVTYVSGYETLVEGNEGRGTQVLIRQLGKGAVEKVKAGDANAFKFNHAETGDNLITIPIEDVVKQSEEIYQSVEDARVSRTGARKTEILLNNIMEAIQENISGYLANAVQVSVDTTAVTSENVKELFIAELLKLAYRPDIAIVSDEVYAALLTLQTTGQFVARFDSVYTGFVGHFLGMDVYIDPNIAADTNFILYNHNHFNVFEMLNYFDLVTATDFNGSYARGLALMGGYGKKVDETGVALTKATGTWGIAHKKA